MAVVDARYPPKRSARRPLGSSYPASVWIRADSIPLHAQVPLLELVFERASRNRNPTPFTYAVQIVVLTWVCPQVEHLLRLWIAPTVPDLPRRCDTVVAADPDVWIAR